MDIDEELRNYAGRWVALVGGRIVAQGGTPDQVLYAAQQERHKEKPTILYVPTQQFLIFPPILERVCEVLPRDLEIYLVGGAIRDVLLRRSTKDLDFALPANAIATARMVADHLGAAFYPLNDKYDTARVILMDEQGDRIVMDFAGFRGASLEADLRGRDFTINAIAADVQPPHRLYDPLGGAADLLGGHLRACSETAIMDDPVRILRGVRLAAKYRFMIEPETRQQMRRAADKLPVISPERIRDELWRILGGPQTAIALRALDRLGVLRVVLPELVKLKDLQQSPPHVAEAWEHTLNTLQQLEAILAVLGPTHHPEEHANNLVMGLAVMRLGRYRAQIADHLQTAFTPDRLLRPLLFMAALYHDVGKPDTQAQEVGGKIRFYKHEAVGAAIAERRAVALRLSKDETQRLKAIIRGHMRPILLSETGSLPSRKAIHRFFRDLGPAGVDVCLLTLADYLAIYGNTLTQERWAAHLDVVRSLLEAWWEKPAESVSPQLLLDGEELMAIFGLPQGPQIGYILMQLREAQAAGEVRERSEALALVEKLLSDRRDA